MHKQSLSIFGQFTGCFLSLIEVTIKNLILKWRTNCKIYLKSIDHNHYLSLLKFKQSFVILPRNIYKEKYVHSFTNTGCYRNVLIKSLFCTFKCVCLYQFYTMVSITNFLKLFERQQDYQRNYWMLLRQRNCKQGAKHSSPTTSGVKYRQKFSFT